MQVYAIFHQAAYEGGYVVDIKSTLEKAKEAAIAHFDELKKKPPVWVNTKAFDGREWLCASLKTWHDKPYDEAEDDDKFVAIIPFEVD
jgi:hypothetical protein